MSGTSSIPSIVSPCRIGTVNGGEGRTKREVDKIDVKREREREERVMFKVEKREGKKDEGSD